MKKLIELDAALEGLENLNAISFYEGNEHSKEAYTETKDMLKALPTVDTVEVVRCKDCKWCSMGECEHKLGLIVANDENYCSYGERKGGDHHD